MKTLMHDHHGVAASPTPATADPHAPTAVVIGSGFGGLAAAIRLAVRGYRVTVVEKLDAPGGRAYVHRQDGFSFDAGPTIITAPFFLEELWSLCGRRMADDVTLVPLEPFYRINFDDGSHFDYFGDPQRMRAEIARLSPGDLAGYERFAAYADLCYRLGFEELGPIAFPRLSSMLKAAPQLLRMQGWRTIYGVVRQHIKDPRLRIAFSFHPLLIGGDPFAVTSVYSLINSLERRFGVHWALGGTGRLVQGLVNLLQSRGGSLRLNSEVRGIDTEMRGGKPVATGVRLASGERLRADIVVSNADSAWTYKHLVDPAHRRHWTDARIARGKYSMSLFVWYFGTDRRFEQVPHHQLLLGPRYRELLRDIFRRHHLAEDFSLYLHRPTATDPSLAPPGCDSFYVLAPVPHLDSGTDWTAMAEPFRRRIAAALDARVMPGFERHIISQRITTPLDFRDRLLSYKGAAFGLEPLMTQSAWFRPHNISEDIDRLFFVGASTHPGAGVPGVLMSAQALMTVVPEPAALERVA